MEENLSVDFKLGRFRNNLDADDLPKYTIAPEIEIESKLIKLRGDTLHINGSLYTLIWDDFVSKPTELSRPSATWSTTCIGTGIRLKMNIKWIGRLSLQGFYGLSRFYFYYDYVGGGSEFPTKDYDEIVWFHELGANLGFRIIKNTYLIAEYSFLDPLQSKGFGDERRNMKIGIMYYIK
jgi:hypothetical protein